MAPQPRVEGAPAGGEHEGISYEYVAPLAAAVDGLAGRGADRAPPAASFRDRFAGSAASTRRPPSPGDACASASTRRECDLVVAYDRSVLRMAPLARLCRRARRHLGARRGRDQRAPARQPDERPLLGLRGGDARGAPALRRPHRHQRGPRSRLPRGRGASRTLVVPGDRGLAARRLPPGPRATPGSASPTSAPCSRATPRRCSSRRCASWPCAGRGRGPRRDRPLRGHRARTPFHGAVRRGSAPARRAVSLPRQPRATTRCGDASRRRGRACSSPGATPHREPCPSPRASSSTCATAGRCSPRTWATSRSTCGTDDEVALLPPERPGGGRRR